MTEVKVSTGMMPNYVTSSWLLGEFTNGVLIRLKLNYF